MRAITTAVAIALYGTTSISPLYSSIIQAAADTSKGASNKQQLVRFTNNTNKSNYQHFRKFNYEPELNNKQYTYIVELKEQSVGQNPLSANALKQIRENKSQNATNAKSKNDPVKLQLQKIYQQQNRFINKAKKQVNNLQTIENYQYAINGFALKLSQTQAMQLADLPEVLSIKRQQIFKTDTDRGPSLIGAPLVWTGDASSSIAQTQGEGVVVGIIDSGVNTDHPSFAEVSGDGYVHTNPLGDGNYLGDCASLFPQLCNNKLIGVYSYAVITNDYTDSSVFPANLPQNGEDYGGHGSHVASTAAGNVLLNVAEVTPELGEEESSGVETGFVFAQLSGVAPRANIISYQACYGGRLDADDTYGNCPSAAIIASIEDAIQDGVDVINFSISGGGNPWDDITERAFLNARSAGIFVATSAGNSGPGAESSDKNAPWYTSVAASEHGRQNTFNKEINNFEGGASSLAVISGQSDSGAITASIVYAGDFANANDPGGAPEQCLKPFPAGTFSGQIVVCDRGEIARIEKAENVRDGGAGGYVLANLQGGETFLANDQYVIPGIHINADDGDRLKAWLTSGTGHSATITEGESAQTIDENRVDVLASFSSRGPNSNISTLTPSMTAPGVDIYAAYADQQFGHDGHTPAASDFDYSSGTSMSSPHVAGAAALLKAAHPNWDPDHIRSALSLTATTAVKREDETTDADFFDMGAGRIQIEKAIATGLIMSETVDNYTNANPEIDGDPRTLNLPSITDNSCAGTCTWERTVTATTDATWTVTSNNITNGLQVSVSPSTFTLNEGESETLSFEINGTQAPKSQYSFASAKLTSPGLPDAQIPISIYSSLGDMPIEIELNGSRQIDTLLITDINAVDLPNFNLTPYQPVKATMVNTPLREDSDNTDFIDDLNDGVILTTVIVPTGALRLITEIKSSSAPDLDLYLLSDFNNDGVPSNAELIGLSTSADSTEEIAIDFPEAGTYFIAVHSYTGSSNQPDDFDMRYAVVIDDFANNELDAIAPSTISANTPFDMRVIHNLPDAVTGDDYYAAIAMGTSAGLDDLGVINVDINRLNDDVSIEGTPTRVDANQTVPLKVIVAANLTNEARNYRIVVPLPVGTEFTSFSTGNQGELVNNELIWLVDKPAGTNTNTELNFEMKALDGLAPGPIAVVVQSQLTNHSFSTLESTSPFIQIQVEGPPVITFNGQASANLSVTELQRLTIPLTITEPNGDDFTISWAQTAGPNAPISQAGGVSSLTAPSVTATTQLAYTVTVTDTNNQIATAQVNVTVLNRVIPTPPPTSSSGGGASSILTLLLLPLVIIRRRILHKRNKTR